MFTLLLSSTSLLKAQEEKPKLIVGIVVDQMRYDYLSRYWDRFGDGGFKRMIREGFSNENHHFNYAPTYTGPGHASIYTGTSPANHGIISNDWYDKESKSMVYCAGDASVETVGSTSTAGKMSPHRMISSTITDELQLTTLKKSKVIGISLKDRGAILPAGHAADLALWFDSSTGGWISSTYYTKLLPSWLRAFNKNGHTAKFLSGKWETMYPMGSYRNSLKDNSPYEGAFTQDGEPVFPYDLKKLSEKFGPGLIRSTPFGNTITKDVAKAAIKGEGMGQDKITDFLALSFSATDYVGHQYGTYAIETEDTYLRLDKDIEDLLNYIDQEVGNENVLYFLTADHGAVVVPSHLQDMKIPGGYFNAGELKNNITAYLAAAYGEGNWMESMSNSQVFLNKAAFAERGIAIAELEKKLSDYILSFDGVAQSFTGTDMKRLEYRKRFAALLQNGYNSKRSGDVLYTLQPGWISYGMTGTTHGSVYNYDTHVPMLWYGWKVAQGSSTQATRIPDIAATIAALLHINRPNACTGEPIAVPLK